MENKTNKDFNRPLISFVIPAYNKEPFLATAVESCLNQTLKEIEVIVVDDGSTDHTFRLMQYFVDKDKRVRYTKLEKNQGRSKARNTGNSMARADIICVLDADDKNTENRAALTYDVFKRKPGIGMFYGSFFATDFYFNPIEQIKAKEFNYDMVKETGMTYIGHSSMAYRKEIALKFPYKADEWADLGLDDWALQMDLYKAGVKFDYTVQPLYYYRQMSDSVSQVRNAIDVYKLKGKWFEEKGERLKILDEIEEANV